MIRFVIQIVKIAGMKIMDVYLGNLPLQLQYKKDCSPVTSADLFANKFIVDALQQFTPTIPVFSEENFLAVSKFDNYRYFWLIDPLDGTRDFLLHNGEFTVNVALVKDGVPVMGVIYVPVINVLYAAVNGRAWKINSNGEQVFIKVKSSFPPQVLLSRTSVENDERLNNYLLDIGECKVVFVGSSLKFCLIAEGKAQLYPRFSSTNIWDTAAGHVIAVTAGAKVNDFNGVPLSYIPFNTFLNPSFQVSV